LESASDINIHNEGRVVVCVSERGILKSVDNTLCYNIILSAFYLHLLSLIPFALFELLGLLEDFAFFGSPFFASPFGTFAVFGSPFFAFPFDTFFGSSSLFTSTEAMTKSGFGGTGFTVGLILG